VKRREPIVVVVTIGSAPRRLEPEPVLLASRPTRDYDEK